MVKNRKSNTQESSNSESQSNMERFKRESEAFFKTIFESGSAAIAIIEADATISMVNNAFCKLSGYSKEELIGSNWVQKMPVEERERLKEYNRRRLIDPPSVPDKYEFTFYKKNGEIRYGLMSVSVIASSAKTIASFTDITDRKQAEEAQRISEERFRSFVECANDVVYTITIEGIFTYTSPNWVEKLGHGIEEVVGHSFGDFVHPDDVERLSAIIKRNFETGEKLNGVEYRIMHKNGQWRWYTSSSSPILNANGQVVSIIGIARDITEKKQAEEALQRSEALLNTLVQTIPDLIWLKDIEGNFLFCNTMFERLFGAKKADIIGKTDYDFVDRQLADFFYENDRVAMAKGKPSSNEEWVTFADDGHRALLDTIKTPMYNSEGKLIGVLGIARDITERNRVEEALKESEFFFKESQRAAFIGSYKADFITGFWESSEVLDSIFGIDKDYDRSVSVGWTNIIHPDDREMMDRYLTEEVIIKHKPFNAEYRIVRISDGETRWVNGLGKVNYDINNNVVSLIGTIQDITERKLAEKVIKESQSMLSLALKIAHLGAWEYDVVNDLFTFNDSFYAIFRTTADEVGGYTMFSADYANRFVHTEDLAFVSTEIRSSIETDDPNYVRQMEHRIIYADGEVGYITVRFAIVKDDKGRTIKTYGINQDITERKLAEEKLIEEQIFNKTLIENLPGIFYLFSYPDLKLVQWNKNQEKILGMTAEEFQNSFSSNWQNAEAKVQVIDLVHRVAKNRYDQAEINLRKKDGNEIPFIFNGARLDTKNQTFIMGFGIDISLQRQVLKNLALNEAKFRTIFNTTSDAIFIHNPFSGEVIDCNQAAFEMYGYSKNEFLKMDINDFSATEEGYTLEKSLEKINTAFKQGAITFEWRGKKKNSTVFWNETNLSKAIIDGEERIVAVVRDIDERKRLLETIRKSEEQYRILAENASDVIWILNLKNEQFTYVSPAIQQLIGLTVEEALKKKIADAITPDSYQIVTATIQKNLPEFLKNPEQPVSNIIQVQQYCNDGRVIWVELSTKYRFNSSGDVEIVGVSRNIEKRKNLEAELRGINATKDKFFSIIAHDLRTPFTSLLGLSEIMAAENSKLTTRQYLHFSQTLYKTADSTFHLLENLLEWARLQRGSIPFNPEKILLKEFFYDIDESTIEMTRKKSIKLTFDFSKELSVTADSNMLHSIMRNLVTNAIKFTNQGGTIIIHANRTEDDFVLITVKDTGIGMTPEMINNLFRIDTNVCRPGTDGEHSTGLGLILCKEFVEKNGGKIWVESEVGKGSTFLFSIPVG